MNSVNNINSGLQSVANFGDNTRSLFGPGILAEFYFAFILLLAMGALIFIRIKREGGSIFIRPYWSWDYYLYNYILCYFVLN